MTSFINYGVPLVGELFGFGGAIVEGSDGNIWVNALLAPPPDEYVATLTPAGLWSIILGPSFGYGYNVLGADANVWQIVGVPGISKITPGGVETVYTPKASNRQICAGPGPFIYGDSGSGGVYVNQWDMSGTNVQFDTTTILGTPPQNLGGFATDGSYLYFFFQGLIGGGPGVYVYIAAMDSSGAFTLVTPNINSSITYSAQPLTFDGTDLWAPYNVGASSGVTRITFAGVVTDYILGTSLSITALCWDGTYLWAGDDDGVWQIDPTNPSAAIHYSLGDTIFAVCVGASVGSYGHIWALGATGLWGPGLRTVQQILIM